MLGSASVASNNAWKDLFNSELNFDLHYSHTGASVFAICTSSSSSQFPCLRL